MGLKHKDRSEYLKKRAAKSVAFTYAVTAHNHCSYMRLNNDPPEVLWDRIMTCVGRIKKSGDTTKRKADAIASCWASYGEVTTYNHFKALREAKGVKNAGKLDLSMPEDGGNAIGPAVQRGNTYVRPIEVLTRGTENILYGAIADEDEDSDYYDASLSQNQQYSWEGEAIGDDELESYDDEGNRVLNPSANGPCF